MPPSMNDGGYILIDIFIFYDLIHRITKLTKKMKISIILLTFVFGIVLGIYIGKSIFQCADDQTEGDTLIREDMEEVFQLILVKQDYSGFYPYTFKKGSFLRLRDKSLLLQAKATGHYGYNIDSTEFVIDDKSRTVTIVLPKPSMLSFEFIPSFVSERLGWLAFSNLEDYNNALSDTEIKIRGKAKIDTKSIKSVQQHAHKVAKILRGYARSMGYDVKIIGLPPEPA